MNEVWCVTVYIQTTNLSLNNKYYLDFLLVVLFVKYLQMFAAVYDVKFKSLGHLFNGPYK